MPTLNNNIRNEIKGLIREELELVDSKARKLAEEHWKQAEHVIAKELGYGDTLTRIEYLKNEIVGYQTELNKLEGIIIEKAQNATQQDYAECGIEVDLNQYGKPYNVPNIFGKEIRTLWDVKVLQYLNNILSFFQVYKNLHSLSHAVNREVLFSGTFEEARNIYQKFHLKIAEAIGADMPKLLNEVESIPELKSGEEQDL